MLQVISCQPPTVSDELSIGMAGSEASNGEREGKKAL